jgi:hypothetical protein
MPSLARRQSAEALTQPQAPSDDQKKRQATFVDDERESQIEPCDTFAGDRLRRLQSSQ